MEDTFRRYPIGIQDFEQLRNNNCIYIDKTDLIYRLVNTYVVYFLSRLAVSARACWYLLWKPISLARKICFEDLP